MSATAVIETTKKQQAYKLTFGRLIELLADPPESVGTEYIDRRINQVVKIGTQRKLGEATGIAKTSIGSWVRNDDWVEIAYKSYVLLASLINNLEPALVDPSDPLKREIRFFDEEVVFSSSGEKIVFPGWKKLQLLHEQSAPSDIDIINEALKDKLKDRQLRATLLNPIKREQIRVVSSGVKGAGLETLVELIQAHWRQIGIDNVESYADWLIEQDARLGSTSPALTNEKRLLIVAGLEQVLNQQLPTGQVFQILFTSLSRHLPNREGRTFGSAPVRLLSYCGIPNPYNTRRNSNSQSQ